MKKIILVAGDKSGDLYGGLLSKKLKEKFPSLEIASFGGPCLAEHSHQIIDLLAHSVSGIFEVFAHLRRFHIVFKLTLKEIRRIKPGLIILIDFPDFNLRLAKSLNKKFPVFYYVSPQVWAWRKRRVEAIKKYVEKMVVIFKFEEEFYRNKGVDVLYFGHPLLEIIEKKQIPAKKIISFMPGSRKNEIKRHLPIMLKAKKYIEKELAGYSFPVIRPDNIEEAFYRKFSPHIKVISHLPETLQESEFIITSSGTATVEIAILRVPFLIIYKVHPLTWYLLKRIVKTKFIGMVNILASKKVIDELLQKEASPQNIAKITLQYLKNRKRYQEVKNELANIEKALSPYGATDKFASFIGQYLQLHR